MIDNDNQEEVDMSVLKNAIKTRKLLKHNRGEFPTFLIYEITKKCNSRCVMCNIWKKKDIGKELDHTDINKIFSQEFFKDVKYLNLSGGEPFLKQDFKDMVKEFIKILKNVELIAVATNGFLTKKIKQDVIEILNFIKEQNKGIKFSLTISIDGPKQIHNKIRGVSSAYDTAMTTFQELKKLENNYDFFTLGVETVICKYNVDKIERIYEAHKKLTNHLNFVPAIYSSFFSNTDLDFFIEEKDIPKVINLYKRMTKETPHLAYFYDKATHYLIHRERTFPCLGGILTARIDSYGNLYPCLMLAKSVATKGDNYSEKWFGDEMNKFRKTRGKLCKRCLSNCDMINNYYYEFFDVFEYFVKHPKISLKMLTNILRDLAKGGYYARMLSRK
jgi:MoaA/NifB/PqqE/SkfB family radical SAM enzyme